MKRFAVVLMALMFLTVPWWWGRVTRGGCHLNGILPRQRGQALTSCN